MIYTSPPAGTILKPSGSLYLGSIQSGIANFTETLVLLDTIETGFTDGIEDTTNHRILPGVAGLYLVSAQIGYRQLTAGSNYAQLLVKLNGTDDIIFQYRQIAFGTSDSNLTIPASREVYLSATDFIDLWALHDCGNADPDVLQTMNYSFLQAQLIRKA